MAHAFSYEWEKIYKNKSRLLNKLANHQLWNHSVTAAASFDGFQVDLWDRILLLVTEPWAAHVESLWVRITQTCPHHHQHACIACLYTEASSVGGSELGTHFGTTWKTDWVCHHMLLRKRGDGGRVWKKKGREEGADVQLQGFGKFFWAHLQAITLNYTTLNFDISKQKLYTQITSIKKKDW